MEMLVLLFWPNVNQCIFFKEDAHIPEYSPFLLKETWGEGLSVITTPVLCTLDLETGKVECIVSKLEEIDPAAKNWSFDDPHYTPDGKGMVFVVYDNQPYRLGLIYCHQRAARLMYWDFGMLVVIKFLFWNTEMLNNMEPLYLHVAFLRLWVLGCCFCGSRSIVEYNVSSVWKMRPSKFCLHSMCETLISNVVAFVLLCRVL